jgi:Flagellar motor protein
VADELGKLPNTFAMEGHTDSKPYSEGARYGSWELSTDRANTTRRLMQLHGIRPDQVTQVRGFADQRLRKKEDPVNPANRRISLIVQYMNRPQPPDELAGAEGHGESNETGDETKSGENHTAPAAESHAAEKLSKEKHH